MPPALEQYELYERYRGAPVRQPGSVRLKWDVRARSDNKGANSVREFKRRKQRKGDQCRCHEMGENPDCRYRAHDLLRNSVGDKIAQWHHCARAAAREQRVFMKPS